MKRERGEKDPLTTCPACFGALADAVLLQCRSPHSLCLRCAADLVSRAAVPTSDPRQVSFPCPVCGDQTVVPAAEGASALKPNTTVRALVERASAAYSSSSPPQLQRSAVPRCPLHGKKLSMFCMDDLVFVCPLCLTSGAHCDKEMRPHRCCTREEGEKLLRKKLGEEEATQLKGRATLRAVEENRRTVAAQIESDFGALLARLTEHKEALLSQNAQLHASISEMISRELFQVEQHIEQLTADLQGFLCSTPSGTAAAPCAKRQHASSPEFVVPELPKFQQAQEATQSVLESVSGHFVLSSAVAASSEKGASKTRLFVGNLPSRLSDNDFREIFKGFHVVDAYVVRHGRSSKGFGFVLFDNETTCRRALEANIGRIVEGHELVVQFSTGNK